jgi:spermidine synthase
MARAFGRLYPRTRVDAVEIDPVLLDLGRRHFDLGGPRLHAYAEDARPFLRRMTGARYDLVVVDAYRQPYIPFYLTTREFFALVRDRLTPRGVLAINVGHPEGSDRLERVLTATLRAVFPHVARDVVDRTNTLVVASRVPLRPDGVRRAAVPAPLRPVAARVAARTGPALRGGEVLTDDHAPVEWLIDGSLVDAATGG